MLLGIYRVGGRMKTQMRYRTMPGGEERLDVAGKTASGEAFLGEIVALNSDGAVTHFARERKPRLAVGQRTMLTFTASWLAVPIEIEATVESREEREAFRCYRFLFEKSEGLESQLSEGLYQVCNRRSALRVEPHPKQPIEVALKIPQGLAGESGDASELHATVRLRDISATGVGLILESHFERVFAAVDFAEMCFCLPPSSTPVHLAAWIRYRQLEGDSVRYGLQFTPKHSVRFEAQRVEIIDYVTRRQRDDATAAVAALPPYRE